MNTVGEREIHTQERVVTFFQKDVFRHRQISQSHSEVNGSFPFIRKFSKIALSLRPPNVYSSFPLIFSKNGLRRSIGIGKTMVEFFSALTSTNA